METSEEVGTQEIPTPPQTMSEPNHNPRGAPGSIPGSSAPVFGDSNGDPSGSPSYNPTKAPSPVPIIKTISETSEIPTKNLSHVPKESQSSNQSNIFMEYPNVYPTGSPITNSTLKPIQSSDPSKYQTQMFSSKRDKRNK